MRRAKFSASPCEKDEDVNFLPYLRLPTTKGYLNLIPKVGSEKLPFHVFSKIFDGLLGYENLSTLKAKINTKNHTLIIKNQTFPFSKYRVNSINFHEQKENLIEISKTANGSFLTEKDIELTSKIIFQPGEYESKNNKAVVHLAAKAENVKCSLTPFTCQYFSMTQEKKDFKPDFPAEHLNSEEEKLLSKTLKTYRV